MLGREGKGREGIGGEIIDTITSGIIRYFTFQDVRRISSNKFFLKQEFT